MYNAILKSPTAHGCVTRLQDFIFGLGDNINGDIIVNRYNQTINDVLYESIKNYSFYKGLALHFNFNIFGEIIEITPIDLRFGRKKRNLKQIRLKNWDTQGGYYYGGDEVDIDLYDCNDFYNKVTSYEDFEQYKGQILYYSSDFQIYPTSFIDSASISASYEKETQIFQYANIKNGFSGAKLIKIPTELTGTDGQEEVMGQDYIPGIDEVPPDNNYYPGDIDNQKNKSRASKLQSQLRELHGAEYAGGSLVTEVPVNIHGEFKDFKMVENLSPTDIDGLFVKQSKAAENHIFKVYMMPSILLGVPNEGMFNQASFMDAYNYKVADTEKDRKIIERIFNRFLPNTIFDVEKIKLEPPPLIDAPRRTNINEQF